MCNFLEPPTLSLFATTVHTPGYLQEHGVSQTWTGKKRGQLWKYWQAQVKVLSQSPKSKRQVVQLQSQAQKNFIWVVNWTRPGPYLTWAWQQFHSPSMSCLKSPLKSALESPLESPFGVPLKHPLEDPCPWSIPQSPRSKSSLPP